VAPASSTEDRVPTSEGNQMQLADQVREFCTIVFDDLAGALMEGALTILRVHEQRRARTWCGPQPLVPIERMRSRQLQKEIGLSCCALAAEQRDVPHGDAIGNAVVLLRRGFSVPFGKVDQR